MGATSASGWDPAQYNRFAGEREQPFWDLVDLLEPAKDPVVVDLGCGDGRLTEQLHRRLGATRTLGLDSSDAMLASAVGRAGDGLSFAHGNLAAWQAGNVDIVLSNAALQWVDDHEAVLAGWRESLNPSGQLAVQMPANADHPSHRIARELAEEWLGEGAPPDPVARNVRLPEDYARMLDGLGFARQHVRLQVYLHHLPSTRDVVEWVKGTSLTRLSSALEPGEFDAFVEEYERRLVAELGEESPYSYAFKRILCWGRLD